ncbi:LGFP repeat-containing protein, partial [Streptomyces sp. NPDC057717]|uniref:LGFP repeat-containing protein n=1 Tax=Streptomyces sp. NPDC057717 TaxID=3346224 RepID=UPI0036B4C055
YWSAATGAHPVWGKIGATWGEYGWENSAFGYPASDETDGTDSWTNPRTGKVTTYRLVTQQYASGATLFWIPGDATEGCDHECTGYEVRAPGSLIKSVRVNLPTDSDKFVLQVFPTDAGFRGGIDKAPDGWQEVWTNTPNPLRLDTTDEAESLRKQYACHAAYAHQESDGGWNTGNSWDLESDLPNVSWTYATNTLFVAIHHCNWT